MHLPSHALLGWLVAESADLDRRDRILVFGAGVIADFDALVVVPGFIAGGFSVEAAKQAFSNWHHLISHNLLSACVYAAVVALLAHRRAVAGGLAFLGFHLHLLCDFIGSAGPDGSYWSLPYLVPFDKLITGKIWQPLPPYQWGLASWQNVTITIVAMLVQAHLGATRGRTIVEVISRRADAAVVEVLRRRWPLYRPPEAAPDGAAESPPDAPPAESATP